ncbi:neuronal acetylcholine receptor subunit alpha-9-like [Argopecten irradians]|uniref:neuronal acetylcholine receptor subunit alpha-9-like n=1 Tax=Argopecten irradians TaxID=31199 RepID=UPI00370F7963
MKRTWDLRPSVVSPRKMYCGLVLVLVSAIYGTVCAQRTRTDDLDRLYKDLTTNYSKDIRPFVHPDHPTIVNVSFTLLSLKEYEEKSGMLAIVGIFTFVWHDVNMMWDRDSYGGLTSILIPQAKVWVPEVFNGRPFEEIEPLGHDRLNVRVYEDGTMLWLPGNVYQTTCGADITNYPFDSHRCDYVFTPWMYFFNEVYLMSTFDRMDLDAFNPNGLWELKSTAMFTDNDVFDSQLLMLQLYFKRRSMFHVVNILVPINVLGILNILVFLLPAKSGERAGFSITVLLAMSVFLTIISDSLPNTSQPNIPRMSYLLLVDMVISSLITLCTILVLRLHNKSDEEDIPRWLRCFSCSSKYNKKRRARFDDSDSFSNINNGEFFQGQTIEENGNFGFGGANEFGYARRNWYRNEIWDYPYGYDTARRRYDNRSETYFDGVNSKREQTNFDSQRHVITWKEVADFFDICLFILFLLLNIAKISASFLLINDDSN